MTTLTIKLNNLWDKDAAFRLLENEIELAILSKRMQLKELLEFSFEMNILITLTDEQLRGMGKTTAIIEKSKELDVPIVTSARQQRDFLEAYSGLGNILYFGSVDAARGVRLPAGFIVDEGVHDEVIKQLIKDGNKLLGGFKRL